MKEFITVEVLIKAPIEKVWEAFTDPEAVKAWNSASPDWHTPSAENDLRPGGKFTYRMEARDGSEGFDFTGEYTEVVPHERVFYKMDDGHRKAETSFVKEPEGVHVITRFTPETENTEELQRAGWQAILDNFKRYVEKNAS